MSNSRVNKEIAEKKASNALKEVYEKKSNLILDHNMAKGWFKDSALSLTGVADKILREKYNLPWQAKFVRAALSEARGKRNPLVSIPKFSYEKHLNDIIHEYVVKNIGKMAEDWKVNKWNYPLAFRDLIEKYAS